MILRHKHRMSPLMTVISDPPVDLKTYETALIERVKEHGWQTTSVGADDNGDPAFSYTTGFWFSVNQPEIVLFDFPPQLSHDVFGQMIRMAREGYHFPIWKPVEGVLSNEIVYLVPATREAGVQYLRSSDWFYKRCEFPVLQLVWSDRDGRFPWENDFDPALMKLQPNLSGQDWAEALGQRADSN